ncbi:MAG: AbrB/MazE/SpoVT family DNA-binding domain-containing protein [Firmicutes bacterium]|nr:AbrB/MazE/SpoVT family DNA-binding domain-containing protein [Bacillota bacterium]
MLSYGIVRKVDELGRIVIPKETREQLQIAIKDPLEIFTDNNTIVLKKYQPGCLFCGKIEGLHEIKGRWVCSSCIQDILAEAEQKAD